MLSHSQSLKFGMGDPEAAELRPPPLKKIQSSPTMNMNNNNSSPIMPSSSKFGFTPTYICSIAGLLRLVNIVIGIIAFGLWLPGYADEFLGERISLQTGDTDKGYGNGWNMEPLNQFVLASIIICLFASIMLLVGLVIVKHAPVDWNRLNKFVHLGLCLFTFATAICAIFGICYFNEHCCHISMDWGGIGITYSMRSGEGTYIRHCYCYLTKYLNSGEQFNHQSTTETVLYVASRNNIDISGMDHNWTFNAHDMEPHLAAIFFILLNCIVYFLCFLFTNGKKK